MYECDPQMRRPRARSFRSLLLVAFLGLALSALSASADLVIRRATVIDVTDGSLNPNRLVLIEDNRIAAIVSDDEFRMPEGTDVVDAQGLYVIPGLWDMHAHAVRTLVDEERNFPLLLAHGVTGIRNMNPAMADAVQRTIEVRNRLATRELTGPRFIAGGPTIDGDPPISGMPMIVHNAAEGRAAVDELADAGMAFVKVYENVPREAYFAIIDQAGRRGLPVVGHLPFRIRPEEAAEAGQRTVEHLGGMAWGCSAKANAQRESRQEIYAGVTSMESSMEAISGHVLEVVEARDMTLCQETADAYARHGVAVVPTLIGSTTFAQADIALADASVQRFFPAPMLSLIGEQLNSDAARATRSNVRAMQAAAGPILRLLRDSGVTFLAGTDFGGPNPSVPGLSLHQEMALLVEAGLTPLEALQAATINAARVLDLADSLGTVDAEKLADLVLLSANPLEDIANTRRIAAVIADGRLYDRAALDALLEVAEAWAANWQPFP